MPHHFSTVPSVKVYESQTTLSSSCYCIKGKRDQLAGVPQLPPSVTLFLPSPDFLQLTAVSVQQHLLPSQKLRQRKHLYISKYRTLKLKSCSYKTQNYRKTAVTSNKWDSFSKIHRIQLKPPSVWLLHDSVSPLGDKKQSAMSTSVQITKCLTVAELNKHY